MNAVNGTVDWKQTGLVNTCSQHVFKSCARTFMQQDGWKPRSLKCLFLPTRISKISVDCTKYCGVGNFRPTKPAFSGVGVDYFPLSAKRK